LLHWGDSPILNGRASPQNFEDRTGVRIYAATTLRVIGAILKKSFRAAAPALGVLLTQGVRFVVPSTIKNWFPYAGPPVFQPGYEEYAFAWIALGHAVQYLWITAYFARATPRRLQQLRYSRPGSGEPSTMRVRISLPPRSPGSRRTRARSSSPELSSSGASGTLRLLWGKHVLSVPFKAK
jgi:hypothetical protein